MSKLARSRRATATALLRTALLCAGPVASGTAAPPSLAQAPSAGRPQEPAPADTLASIRAALEAGDQGRARALLHAAVQRSIAEPDAAGDSSEAQLIELDGIAEELGSLEDSLALREHIVLRRGRRLARDDRDLLVARLNLAATRFSLGDLAGARELQEDVVAAWTRLLPADHADLLRARQHLGSTLFMLGDHARARDAFEEVLAARVQRLPAEHAEVLLAKTNLALAYYALGDLAGAQRLLEEVVAVRGRLHPAGHADLLHAQASLAATRGGLGDFVGARELQEEVLAGLTQLLTAEHPEVARAKLNLGSTLNALGDIAGAHTLFEEALAAWERLLPADHQDILTAKLNLAVTRRKLGDLAGARALSEDTVAAWTRLLPADHPHLLTAQAGLAVTKRMQGDVAGARELEERILAARMRLLPPEHLDLLEARLNLAQTLKAEGDYAGALELEQAVLARWTPLLPADHHDLLATRLNLGGTLYCLGDLAAARRTYEEILATWAPLLPPHHPDLIGAKHNLSVTLLALGDHAPARELFEEVLATWTQILPVDHPDLLRTKLNLAWTRHALGDAAGACELVSSMLAGQRARARGLRFESPRAAREAARAELRRVFDALFLCAGAEEESYTAELFATLESLRHASVASPEIALAIADRPDLAAAREALARRRSELNNLVAAGPEAGQALDAWRTAILELANERDRLERSLRSALAGAGATLGEIDARAVAAALEPDGAAVSYLRPSGTRPAEDPLLAFVVRPDASVRRVELGPAQEIESLVRGWRAAIGKPIERGVAVESGEEPAEEAGRALRERLIDPLLAAAGGDPPRTLHVVLDDLVHLVPLDALPQGGGLVGERLRILIEPSFGRLAAPPRPPREGGTLLAVGGVDFDQTSEEPLLIAAAATPPLERSGRPETFASLRQTRYEVEDVATQFEEAFARKPVLLVGGEATKPALARHARSARFLHLATHGWFAPEAFRSQLDGEPDAERRELFLRAEQTVRGFAPETLCGLALAGANQGRDAVARMPGILTAEELGALDLAGCELAVLSACETNVGLRRAGQGIQSLQAALHGAGARTAITSLWKVDDAATRRLFELFYTKLWKEKLGKHDALWQAKMALRAAGHPARDWAGWVLTGVPD